MGRKRKKKNKALSPRCKRMKRPARLKSAVSWLEKFSGENVLRGYCKRYAPFDVPFSVRSNPRSRSDSLWSRA